MQDQCPRKVTHSNNTRTAMSPGGSHRQLFRSVRTHQYSFHVRTAPFTRTRIFFKPHFFYTIRPSFHTKLANPLTGNDIFLKPLHTVFSSRTRRIANSCSRWKPGIIEFRSNYLIMWFQPSSICVDSA